MNVIRINPSDNDTVVVGGRFDNAGSLNCVNICSYNVPASQWQPLGTGLQGTVNDITYANVSIKIDHNMGIVCVFIIYLFSVVRPACRWQPLYSGGSYVRSNLRYRLPNLVTIQPDSARSCHLSLC